MEDGLAKRGKSMEEMFFMQRDAELIAQRKKLEAMNKTKVDLAQISGIKNEAVLDKLVALGVSPASLASLVMVPLVEVAWADGTLSDQERKAILDEAAHSGMTKGSVNYDILQAWLKQGPEPHFLEAWSQYVKGLKDTMHPQEFEDLKNELLTRAKKVAASSGGFLGVVGKISPEETAALKKLESVF